MNKIMENYIKLVEFLGLVLGSHCEIVLQDLSDDVRSIVAIANGNVSNRKVGSPLTDYALGVMTDESWKTMDYHCNYKGRTKDNKVLKSSTFFIKDKDKLIGMLCINIDNQKYVDASLKILELSGVQIQDLFEVTPQRTLETVKTEAASSEMLTESLEDMVNLVVQDYCGKSNNIPADHLSQEDKINIVKLLDAKGLFLLKGIVPCVADKLYCSEASVYRYLSKLSKAGNSRA